MFFLAAVFSVFFFCIFSFGIYAATDETDIKKDLNKDLNKVQDQLEKEQEELQQTQVELQATQGEINITAGFINKTETEISRKEGEIDNLNQRIELNKKILGEYIQEMFIIGQSDQVLGLAISDQLLNEYQGDFDQMISVKERVLGIMGEINEDKKNLSDVKEELTEKKEEHQELLADKYVEKNEIVGDIIETQATIGELQKKLAELQSDLLALTGTSYSAKDIKEAVEFASGKMGVPKGVLYGFLQMETRLGKNTGQCTYSNARKVALDRYKKLLKNNKKWQASIDLLEKRYDIFKDIVGELGYGKNKKVSCTPTSYIGQGGAMGVAQFMPDVWRGYESSVRARTGHKNPDPWDLTDGVMAMAIKLKNAGATSSDKSVIKKASINYLGGFNSGYYEGIVYWSKNYKTLFD